MAPVIDSTRNRNANVPGVVHRMTRRFDRQKWPNSGDSNAQAHGKVSARLTSDLRPATFGSALARGFVAAPAEGSRAGPSE
jgi:hypothetical protein